jgi:hypothetical protein
MALGHRASGCCVTRTTGARSWLASQGAGDSVGSGVSESDPLRGVRRERFDVARPAVAVLPDAFPYWRLVAEGRPQLEVVVHAKASARRGREGRNEVAGLGHAVNGKTAVDPCTVTNVTANDWRVLSAALAARPGWHAEEDGAGPFWGFGLEGACRLVLSMTDTGFHLYDDDASEVHDFGSKEELAMWLADHEAEHEGFTGLQTELIDQFLPVRIEEWGKERD